MHKRAQLPPPLEHYELEEGGYALYVEQTRLFVTPTVAVLIDPAGDILVTHGPPAVVREEFDALRRFLADDEYAPGVAEHCVMIEGSPPLEVINLALRSAEAVPELRRCLQSEDSGAAARCAAALLQRVTHTSGPTRRGGRKKAR